MPQSLYNKSVVEKESINDSRDHLVWMGVVIGLSLLAFLISFLFEQPKFDPNQIIRILTGNYFIDALLSLIMTSPITIPIALVSSLWLKMVKRDKLSFFKLTLTTLAIVYIFIAIFYIGAQIVIPLISSLHQNAFKYIRPSVGAAFLAAVFSFWAYYIYPHPTIIKKILFGGMLMPVLLVPFIPWSLEINDIAWSHFQD
ncbi:hypothetical protein THII_3877 [Thioploca ingrica]|uniref:Uncharacterized protein n=1 Tax=Thioploca ingrica TaxID=40754 RepID=A0A090AKQ9_9GAMM|nr:hypothetical protein THII_3877 [Thioploca ingrica]